MPDPFRTPSGDVPARAGNAPSPPAGGAAASAGSIRTALGLVMAPLAEALDDSTQPLPAGQRARIESARRSATALIALVEGLLDGSAKARLDAEAANRAKDEFIAMISHELRTPLGAILIWAQLLRAEELDATATTRAVGMIERSTKTLAQLIDDLLDVSRIIAGKLTFEARPVDLRFVVEAALDAAQPAAESKGLTIERVIETGVPPISGDAGRLQQVVGNLLANAIKFTPEGGRVEVALQRSGARARIRVRDTGSGIRAEFLPFIFERFRQADNTSTRKQKGLGLGLAIARHIVEMHGGSIEAASSGEGEGSTFTVTLPLVLRDEEEAGAGRAAEDDGASAETTLSGVRILIVDDEEDAREAMVVLLSQAGASVECAGSAAEALSLLRVRPPDLLLSDIAMPGEDGYSLIRQVRSLGPDRGGRIPAAALTAYATLDDRRKALLAGYDEHIPKPVDPQRLIATVASLVPAELGRSGGRRRAAAASRWGVWGGARRIARAFADVPPQLEYASPGWEAASAEDRSAAPPASASPGTSATPPRPGSPRVAATAPRPGSPQVASARHPGERSRATASR